MKLSHTISISSSLQKLPDQTSVNIDIVAKIVDIILNYPNYSKGVSNNAFNKDSSDNYLYCPKVFLFHTADNYTISFVPIVQCHQNPWIVEAGRKSLDEHIMTLRDSSNQL